MIIVKNKKLLIPTDERYIAADYDANTGIRQFQIDRYSTNETDLAGLTPTLVVAYEDGTQDICDLGMEVSDRYIVLTLTVPASVASHPGTMFVNIKMTDSLGTVRWASFIAAFYAEKTGVVPTVTDISLFEQIEARANEALAKASTAAGEATAAALAADEARAALQELISSGDLIGPKGDKGDPGIQGIQGPPGPKGDTGPKGESGIVVGVEGSYTMYVDADGYLKVRYIEGTAIPEFIYDPETGLLKVRKEVYT